MNARFFGMVVVGTVLVSNPAAAAEIVRPHLVARLYQTTPIRSSDWTVTMRETSAILDVAGIDIEWVSCLAAPAPAGAVLPARCALPLKTNEVAIRVVRGSTTNYRHELPLGESFVDTTRHAGSLATIYLDRVEWLARAGGVSVNLLLGRAIAHELGHLLLGTNAHSRRGLMRPVWTRDEVVRAEAPDWLLPRTDAARVRAALEAR